MPKIHTGQWTPIDLAACATFFKKKKGPRFCYQIQLCHWRNKTKKSLEQHLSTAARTGLGESEKRATDTDHNRRKTLHIQPLFRRCSFHEPRTEPPPKELKASSSSKQTLAVGFPSLFEPKQDSNPLLSRKSLSPLPQLVLFPHGSRFRSPSTACATELRKASIEEFSTKVADLRNNQMEAVSQKQRGRGSGQS